VRVPECAPLSACDRYARAAHQQCQRRRVSRIPCENAQQHHHDSPSSTPHHLPEREREWQCRLSPSLAPSCDAKAHVIGWKVSPHSQKQQRVGAAPAAATPTAGVQAAYHDSSVSGMCQAKTVVVPTIPSNDDYTTDPEVRARCAERLARQQHAHHGARVVWCRRRNGAPDDGARCVCCCRRSGT
jgi:hypothetical protein